MRVLIVEDEQGLHERIALEGPQDELKELADTFDDMLQRLDSQRRFVDNASRVRLPSPDVFGV